MKERRKISLILEVLIIFAISVLLTGLFMYYSLLVRSRSRVTTQIEHLADEISLEVKHSILEYPGYQWLLRYWYTHADELEIEYDAGFDKGTQTEAKSLLLQENYPDFQIRYADETQIEALPEEYQKLYAEIVYSWIITDIDQIKRSHQIDYLFCVLTDESCSTQFFLLSAADEGSVRGTNYEEVYPLGVEVTVSESQQSAMLNAERKNAHLADAGSYVDYYAYLESVDGHPVFIGMTYNLSYIEKSIVTETGKSAVFAISFQILLSIIFLLLVILVILHPLQEVMQAIRYYKQTKDREHVIENLKGIRLHNEIGQLSEDVMNLAIEMDDYMDQITAITAEKERIVTELEMAHQIQASMMPHVFPPFPDRSEFDIYAVMEPAKAVGGDFFDFFLIDHDHLGLLIADVSGKGVPAALFMMAVKIVLQNCAMLGGSAEEILTRTNEAICANNQQEMFVTVWVGILEISTGRLTAANAGHEYPILKKPGGKFEILRDKHGLVIGGMEGVQYQEYELFLKPGTKLFLYTDGVPEATDADHHMFGTERLLDALNSQLDISPEKHLEVVRNSVSLFVKDAEQFDDLTMMCLEYKGPAQC